MKPGRIIIAVVFVTAALASAAGIDQGATLTGVRQINEKGFGTDANKYAWSMTVFNDALYVGTLNIRGMPGMFRFASGTTTRRATNGAEIWRYDGESWEQVVAGGLNSRLNFGVRKMLVMRGCLWAVTANYDEGFSTWRSCDGENWQVMAERGFGKDRNISGRGLADFNGYIYVGAENRREGGELWRSRDGTDWELVADRGITHPGNFMLMDFTMFKGHMYMGTANVAGMQLIRTADGENFEKVEARGLAAGTNSAVMKICVFRDRLYFSTGNFFRGFDLYSSADGENFERVLKNGYTTRANAYLWYLQEYEGRLYAGTYHHGRLVIPNGKFDLYSSPDGKNWTLETDDAFGSPWYYGVRTMEVYRDRLIIGTASAQYGAKIFEARIE